MKPRRVLKVVRLSPDAVLPTYAHPGDAGLDLVAGEAAVIPPGAVRGVGTGIAIQLPPGCEAQIRPRSGLALKHGLSVPNAPGTIDNGYRGEIRVILINHGRKTFRVIPGMKIAQMVIAPVMRVAVRASGALSRTARGRGGFGSTGVHAAARPRRP